MFKLRAQLRAHEADVKSIACSPSSTMVATASRDKTVCIWDMDATVPKKILRGHSHFVNDVVFIDDQTVVSSSNDQTIRVWNIDASEPDNECVHVLKGHTASVCALAIIKDCTEAKCIISASWDNTARIWNVDNGSCIYELKSHSAAVWNCASLGNGQFITVSADKSVQLWSVNDLHQNVNNNQVTTLTNSITLSSSTNMQHTDVIRDVTDFKSTSTGLCFATVANDSKLITWKKEGDSFVPSATLPDLHDGDYVYSIDKLLAPDALFTIVTGGEDNAVRLTTATMNSGEVALQAGQVIMHPSTVWSVCTSSDNKHILTACSDGVARIFTNDSALQASEQDLQEYKDLISKRKVDTRLIGGVDVTKLPQKDAALTTPGAKDGETRIVKSGDGNAEVYMWSNANYKWTKVGDVVDGPNSSTNQDGVTGLINGKEYDFTFEVELDEGGPKKKLGYNKGENPYLAAQRFIDENELSQEFLAQIADFIEKNVPKHVIEASNNDVVMSDPLTGGSRYVPGAGAGASSSNGAGSSSNATKSFPTWSAPTDNLPPAKKFIPHSDGMICYKSSDQLDKIQQKLSESNTQLAKDEALASKALTIEEATIFAQQLMPKLKSNSRNGSAMIVSDEECAVVEKMIMQWPMENAGLFAALDVGRLIICSASGSTYFFGRKNGDVLTTVLTLLSNAHAKPGVLIMACRFLCNMFGNRVVKEVTKTNIVNILQTGMKYAAKSPNRRARETFASLLLNYAILYMELPDEIDGRIVLQHVINLVNEGEKDEDVVFRLLIAMGTVMCSNDAIAQTAVELGAAQAAADCAPLSPRIQQVALDIATLIAK